MIYICLLAALVVFATASDEIGEGYAEERMFIQDANATLLRIDAWETEMLNSLNALRRSVGRSPVSIDNRLRNAARAHSQDQNNMQTMTHTGSDGSSVGQRVTRAGYPWRGVAENVARGQRSVSAVMTSWTNSAGHYRNMIGDYTHVGFGNDEEQSPRHGLRIQQQQLRKGFHEG